MATGEFKPLLDRDFVKAAIQPITDITTPLLRELVDASLRAFRRCEMEAAEQGKPNEDVAALVLFRQIIEMADGVEVLIAEGCGTAAIPVVRSQFEASASLSYLLNDDAKYTRKLPRPVNTLPVDCSGKERSCGSRSLARRRSSRS